jgi:hypothetical protein
MTGQVEDVDAQYEDKPTPRNMVQERSRIESNTSQEFLGLIIHDPPPA